MGFTDYAHEWDAMEVFALNALWIGPIGAGTLGLFLSRRALIGWTLTHGFLQLLVWGYLYTNLRSGEIQATLPWFELGEKSFRYALSFYAANAWLLLLTIVVGHAALFYSFLQVGRIRSFVALLLLTIGFCQGVFLAKDIVLFFVFYEASLIPAFLLVYGWGGRLRQAAAIRFALFTLSGSVLLLVGILWTLWKGGSPAWDEWRSSNLPVGAWGLMSLGLAVKLPLIPVHSWLGEAHVEAETPVSMVLAGVLLKLGGFALLNWVWFANSPTENLLLRVWGGLTLLYAVAVATGQRDLKRIIAFTSIAHMALVAIGAGSPSSIALRGAYHQLFTHGVISAGLFAWAGLLEKATGSRALAYLRGVLQARPHWHLPGILLFFAGIGAPGFAPFISEMLIIWGTGEGAGWTWAFLPALSVPLTGFYFLRAYRELARPPDTPWPKSSVSLFPLEATVWALLLLALFAGIYPKPWLDLLSHVGH